ncbi:hypothetical protein FACS189450_13200 [Spirochaetia bacterium]|nr:hypothetical protein FACS189450_13200 [Spirochaetia bacterium]
MKRTLILLCLAALIGTAAFAQEEAPPAAAEQNTAAEPEQNTSAAPEQNTTPSSAAAESNTAAKAGLPLQLSVGGGYVYGYGANQLAFTGKVQGAKIYTIDQSNINANGISAFFDATYGIFAIDLFFPVTKTDHYTYSMYSGKNAELIEDVGTALKFELLGKYPFAIGSFSIFPLLGVNYTLDFGNIDNSKLGFAGGCGLDIPLSIFSKTTAVLEKLYIRVEALYGLQLKSPAQLDAESAWKADQENIVGYTDLKADAGLTHGPQIKLGVGYKF